MGDSIDMNVGVFWETSEGFSQNKAKVMLIWMSKVGENSTALKNRQVFLVFSIYM